MGCRFGLTHSTVAVSQVQKALIGVVLLIAIVGVYWQSTGHEFIIYDDHVYVTDNVHVSTGLSSRNVLWAFTTIEASNWHPLTWLSHMLDCQIFGLNPKGHHLTNILFHAANTLLLWYLLFYVTQNFWQSILVAGLFALHPLHVESVAWIAERKDLLSAFFMFATLTFYSRYAKECRPWPYITALLLYGLGLMSKPMLVTLPFVMMLWDFWPLGRLRFRTPSDVVQGSPFVTPRRLISEKVPFFVLSLLSSIVTYYAQSHGGSVAGAHAVPFAFRFVNALVSYTGYILKMIWPFNLAVIYPLPPTLTLVQAAVSGLILVGITLVVCNRTRVNPFLLTGWFWYLGTLVPVIGFVQVGRQAMADRYTYIPLIGLFIIISWGLSALTHRLHYRRLIATAVGLLMLAGATACTWKQVGYWKNDITLFTHAIQVVRDNHIAHMNLGLAFFERGNIEEAIKHYYEALALGPKSDDLCYYLGLAFGMQGNLDESIAYFTKAVTINPKFADAHYNLGVALAKQRRFEEGIRHFKEALRLDPGLLEARKALETAMRSKSEQSSH
jgi:protein O-mannosyl-transferase